MKIIQINWHLSVSALCIALPLYAANLANPAITLPEARVAIGASYYLGGYNLTNRELPSLFNRIHGRIGFAPLKYVTFGIDLGTTQIDVDQYMDPDTVPLFHGKFGFSGGGHLKLSTPSFLKQYVNFILIAQATYFKSENEFKASYGGMDGTGALGIQVRIPGFGYISAGPWVYNIQGSNKSYTGETGFYSNTDNIRGWLAIDFFPKMAEMSNNKPYVSLEISISPNAAYSERIPVQAYSISLSVGSVTKRLYGVESDVEWEP